MREEGHDVTTLLAEMSAGEEGAEERLFNFVYKELKRMARQLMQHERAEHTLQPTALVNEAVLKLLEGRAVDKAHNSAYFFGMATRAMRQVLVDHARKKGADKRGGGVRSVPLDSVLTTLKSRSIDILALDEALATLRGMNERQHDVVMLRFFAGLTMKQISGQLEVSLATVENDFRFARAWLHGQLSED